MYEKSPMVMQLICNALITPTTEEESDEIKVLSQVVIAWPGKYVETNHQISVAMCTVTGYLNK